MTYSNETAGRSRLASGSADNLDRILLGACAAIWLAALGAAVAATVALVDLGGGHPEPSGDSDTPWLLYTVIGISAVVIIGAVPLLLRARRTAQADPRPARTGGAGRTTAAPSGPVRGIETPTGKLRMFGPPPEPAVRRPGYLQAPVSSRLDPGFPTAAVDQLWLRCALVTACAMGVAMIAIGVATYLMAADSDTAAWAVYVVAGLVTLAMPAIPWFYLRQLRELLDSLRS